MFTILYTKDKIISKIPLIIIDFENFIYIKGHCIGISSDYCILINNNYIIGSKILNNYDFYVLKDTEKEIEGFSKNEVDNVINYLNKFKNI